MKKMISLLAAGAMLLPCMQLSARALQGPEANFRLTVQASKDKAKAGDTIDFDLTADKNFDDPVCGLFFNLDIPEGFEFVEGSFTINESGVTQLGLADYDFDEESELPYYFSASAAGTGKSGTHSGKENIATFKCKVKDDTKGVFSVNTINNTCVYVKGDRAERCEWSSEAAVVRVGVPDSEPTPPVRPKDPSEEGIYRAYIGFADADWSVQSWDSNTVIKEGENSITFKVPHDKDNDTLEAEGVSMLVIDFLDCLYEVGYVRVTDILVDGKKIAFDDSKIIYGADDHSDEDNYRIEIFSDYGATAKKSPISQNDIRFDDELTVNFIVSSDRLAEDDRVVYGKTIAGHSEGEAVPLEGCRIRIARNDEDVFDNVFTGSKFDFKIPRGHYNARVYKDGYVTKVFDELDVGKTVPEELKCIELNAYGDVNGDCKVDIEDAAAVIMHINGVRALSDYYSQTVADVDFNNNVDIEDVVIMINHINGISVIKKK